MSIIKKRKKAEKISYIQAFETNLYLNLFRYVDIECINAFN